MTKSKVIGRVSVKVWPDTKLFKQKLKRDLRAIEDYKSSDYALNQRVDLKYDDLRKQAVENLRRLNKELATDERLHVNFRAKIDEGTMPKVVRNARKQLQSLARSITKHDPISFRSDVDITKVDVDQEAKKVVERELREWAKDMSPLTVYVKPEMLVSASRYVSSRLTVLTRPRTTLITPTLNEAAVARVATVLGALSGGRAVWDMGSNFWDSLQEIDKAAPKIAGLSLGLLNLSSSALVATSNLFTFGASLASISATALTLPGLIGGIAIGLGVTTAALKDFNTELPQVKKGLEDMQDALSASFWREAQKPMERFFDTLLPQFSAGTSRTGKSLGSFFANLSDSLEGALDGSISTMFDDLNQSIEIASLYTDNYAGAITTLGRVGAAHLPRLASYFGTISADFDSWLSQAEKDGRLQGWVDTGIDNLGHLGTVVRETGSTFGGLARAMERAGGSTLEMMADTMESVSDTVNSPKFQSGMVRAFKGAHQAIDAIAKESGPEFESFVIRTSDLLATTLPTAGRASGKALGAIFSALDQPKVQRSVSGFFENVEDAVDTLAPAMPELAGALTGVVDVTGELANSVAKVLSPAIENLGPQVENVADIVGPFAGLLGDVLGVAVDGVTGLIGGLPPELVLAGAAMIAFRKATASTGDVMSLVNAKTMRAQAGFWSLSAAVTQGRPSMSQFRQALLDVGTSTDLFVKGSQARNKVLAADAKRSLEARAAVSAYGRQLATAAGQYKGFIGQAALTGFVMSGAADSIGLANTASMAMAGSMAGPWGTAAGATIGLLMDLSSSTKDFEKAIDQANSSLQDSRTPLSKLITDLESGGKAYQNFMDDATSVTGVGDFFDSGLKSLGVQLKSLFTLTNQYGVMREESAQAQQSLENLFSTIGRVSTATGNGIVKTGDFEKLTDVANQAKPALESLGTTWAEIANMSAADQFDMASKIIAEMQRLDTVPGRVEAAGTAFANLGNDLEGTSASASKLNTALQAVLDPQIDAEQAAMQWRDAIRSLKEELNGQAGLKGFSAAVDQNKQTLIGAVQNLQSLIVAQAGAGKSGEQLTQRMANGRQAIIDQATAIGLNAKEVDKYLTHLGLTPEFIRTTMELNGIDAAQQRILAFNQAAKGLPKNIRTALETVGYPLTKRQLKDLATAYENQPDEVETRVRAIVEDAKVDTEAIQAALDQLDGKTADPSVSLNDKKASSSANALEQSLAYLDGYKASPTARLNDQASKPLKALQERLNDFDGTVFSAVVEVQYRTKGDKPGGGGGKGGGAGADPNGRVFGRAAANALGVNILYYVNTALSRLDAGTRAAWTKAQDKWLERVRTSFSGLDGAISDALGQAENKLGNASAKAKAAQGKKATKQANKQLAAAKAQLAALKQYEAGWNHVSSQIEHAVELYEDMNTELLSAVSTLESLQSQVQSFKDGIRDGLLGAASILEAPMATFSSMEKHLERQIKSITEYKAGIEDLESMGLSQEIIKQLGTAGPESIAFIRSILKEGAAGVARLNELWGQVENLSTGVGNSVGDYVYRDEIQNATDAVDLLLGTLQNMRGPIEQASNALMNAISSGAAAASTSVVQDMNNIIDAYTRMKSTLQEQVTSTTPGLLTSPTGSILNPSSTVNDNRTFNINIAATTQSGDDLFAAAQTVKAVISSA